MARAREHGPAFGTVVALASECSPYLRQLIVSDPDRLDRLASCSPEASLMAVIDRQRSVEARFRTGDLSRDAAIAELRRAKQDQALLIALADLSGIWPVDQVVSALSDFADASVQSAVGIALAEAEAAGTLEPGSASASGLVVLALGKHGARELNYSSDVDLVVFYDPQAPTLRAGTIPGRFYTKLAQSTSKLLQERTVDGYVHRVDYRLRPDPGSTPVAVSLPAAYTYYETLGQNWERAAMIKARPVAGDQELGRTFLRELEPFVWRKYFDFGAIADIHAMKRQIHAVRGHGEIAVAGHDIKVGRGGIREIEFFVQTQQLVFGGRRPVLRGQRTLDMLAGLHSEGWVSREARDQLSEAYRFLRCVEHRIQMVADEQTQRLPSDERDLESFGRFCGYSGRADFSDALTEQARRVQRHYGLLFERAPELASDLGNLVFAGPSIDPATVSTLRDMGFEKPEVAAETVRGWHFGRRAAVTSARAREVLTDLVPSLLAAFSGSSDPDGGLARLDTAFGRMPAAVELLTILRSHDRLRLLFADLLGSAPRLADIVAATPHVLDAVLNSELTRPFEAGNSVEEEVLTLVGHPPTLEEFLDATRDAVRYTQFATGARMLSGALCPSEAGGTFAAIARAVIQVSLDRVATIFAGEHGTVQGGRMVVLGLGRLGAGNLTASSDLDLVVVYDFDPGCRLSTGARPLDAATYYMRLTQRLVSSLTVPTRRGRLYEVDLRLRPQGRKGPIASKFSGFVAYHAGDAETWESMALTRSKVVAGDAELGAAVRAEIDDIICRPREIARVYGDVSAMRDLVEREKAPADDWDIKLVRGGLLDLDFLAQALTLAHAAHAPALMSGSTPEILTEAGRLSLIDPGLARELSDAYVELDNVLHWQRLTMNEGQGSLDAAGRRQLARLIGAPDEAELGARLRDVRLVVRGAFDRTLGCVGTDPTPPPPEI